MRRDWQIALAITVVLRVFYSAVAALAALLVHHRAGLIRSNALTEMLPSTAGWHYALTGVWERFDTLWYLRIAERGYDLPGAVVFYPLYPALIRALGWVVEPRLRALLISTVAAFFYFLGLLRLARGELAGATAERAVLLAAAWPASFFLFAGYTEALAMALIVWCIAWARDERWLEAAACAFAAGLDAISRNAVDRATTRFGLAGTGEPAVAGLVHAARNDRILDLAAPERTAQPGGGLWRVLENVCRSSVDYLVAGDSFAGAALRASGRYQSGGSDLLLCCGRAGAAAGGRPLVFGGLDYAYIASRLYAGVVWRPSIFIAGLCRLSNDW